MNRLALLLLICCYFSCGTGPDSPLPPEEPTTDTRFDSLTLRLDSIFARGHINGMSVAIVDSTGPLYLRGFGKADRAAGKPYTEHTLQNIASISKTFIGIALLKAQEMGLLDLDDPVNQHLPFTVTHPLFPDVPITLRHLATHTSGIQDGAYYEREAYVLWSEREVATPEGIDNFKAPDAAIPMLAFLEKALNPGGEWYAEDNFLATAPGEWFEYTNVGATLAAAAVEVASGKDYADFVREHILEPLDMSASGFSLARIDSSQHSVLYQDLETPLPNYHLITYPDGGMRTSAADMGKYITELIRAEAGQGTLLEPESYAEFFRGVLEDSQFEARDVENPYNDEYDMGVFIGLSGPGYVGHTGGDPGVVSLMFFNPKTGVGRYLVLNTVFTSKEAYEQFVACWETLNAYPS